jgi:hypothetical protein
MGTVSSPSELQDVGGSSGGPPPISSSAIKRNKWVKSAPAETQQKSLKDRPLKRPITIETSTNKQPAAKQTKHSATGSQEKTSTSSPLKRPIETLTKCRMDLPWPTTSVGTRTDYSVGPWDYPTCAARHLMAWSTRTIEDKYSVRKLYMSRTVWKTPRRTRLVLSPWTDL